MEEEPKDDSQQKIEIEKLQGELSTANQEIKKLQSEIKLSEEDRIQHRIMKGISKLVVNYWKTLPLLENPPF